MLSFTLDTNCLIAVEEGRVEKVYVERLVSAHRAKRAEVGLVAISASERQRDGSNIENFGMFQERVKRLGLGELELLAPMFYWDVTFWDFSLWTDGETEEDLERKIHEILFPNIEFNWIDYARARGLDQNSLADKRWRNAKCDVQAFWSHASRKRDVFVSSDKNFHAATKRPRLLELAGGHIEYPEGAAEFMERSGDAA